MAADDSERYKSRINDFNEERMKAQIGTLKHKNPERDTDLLSCYLQKDDTFMILRPNCRKKKGLSTSPVLFN